MALIKCPECGKEISDQATSCPNCGYPISNEKKEEQIVEEPLVEVVDDAGMPEDEVIDIEPPSEEHQREEEPPKPKKGSAYKIGAIIGGVVVVAAIAFFGFFSASSNEKEALAEDLSGLWYTNEHGENATLEFETNRLVFNQDLYEWEDPAVIDSDKFGWETDSKDTILIGGKEYTVTFGEDKTTMNLYPALTHDADFETFIKGGNKEEVFYDVSEVSVDSTEYDAATDSWKMEMTLINNGKDSYTKFVVAWRFEDEDDDVLDKEYLTVTPKDGALEPGETEIFTLEVPASEIQNSDDLDGTVVVIVGQEKV